MSNVKIWCCISNEFPAIHRWENAPEEVPFLRCSHRHLFKVKVHFEQFHNNRDIEFILAKKDLNNIIMHYFYDKDLNQLSCEMIAKIIYDELIKTTIPCLYKKLCYKDRDIKIEIFEDGENGAIVEFNK